MSQVPQQILALLAPSSRTREKLTNVAAIFVGFGAVCASWCMYDYQKYLALGPGGPPYNIKGWAMITFMIRPFALSYQSRLSTVDYPREGTSVHIDSLPERKGERARTGGIAPHRQLTQHAPESMRSQIEALFKEAALQNADLFEMRLSLYERHHPALFLCQDVLKSASSGLPNTAIVARGEIGHFHPDLSVHLYVSPADARTLIEKGWAERHRLAVPKTSWVKNQYAVADTYLMVYGPRDEAEVECLQKMLIASMSFMSGGALVALT